MPYVPRDARVFEMRCSLDWDLIYSNEFNLFDSYQLGGACLSPPPDVPASHWLP